MAAAIRDVWVNSTANANLAISVNGAGILGSGGVQANDYLIYAVVSDSQFSSATFPSGFGTATSQACTADSQELACAQKLATGSETSLTATASTDTFIGLIVAVSGVDTTTPLDVAIVVTNSNTASASPRTISGSITPATNGAMIIAITGTDVTSSGNSTTTVSTTSGTTGSWTNNASADLNSGFRNIAAGWASQTTAGAVTIQSSSTFASGNAGITQFLIAVRPSASGGVSISPGLGQLTITGLAPSLAIGGNQSVSTGLGALTITGLAPSLAASGNVFISPSLGQMTITGFAPTLGGAVSISPGLGQLTLTGLAPSVSATAKVFITPGLGALSLAGFAPSQDLVLGAPGTGALVLTGLAPTVQVSASGQIQTALGQLVLTGYAPSVDTRINAGLGALSLTGFAPSITQSLAISSGLGQLVLTGLVPSVSATANQFATSGLGQLSLTGFAPSMSQAGAFSVTPDTGILQILGLAPDIVNSGDRPSGAGGGKGRKRRKYRVEIDGEVFAVASESEAIDLLTNAREVAEQKAADALERAIKAEKRPLRKILADVRKSLPPPVIKTNAPIDIGPTIKDIEEFYKAAMQKAELAVLMRKQQEEDDADNIILSLL